MLGAVAASVWCCSKLIKMAQQAEAYDEDMLFSNQRANKWFELYSQSCKELELTEQELSSTEEELFDLQQSYSELGTAYNDLKDILIENGIDPDLPQY